MAEVHVRANQQISPIFRLSSAFDNKIFHRKDYYYFSLADKLGANFTAFAVHVLEDLKKNKCSAGDGYRWVFFIQ